MIYIATKVPTLIKRLTLKKYIYIIMAENVINMAFTV